MAWHRLESRLDRTWIVTARNVHVPGAAMLALGAWLAIAAMPVHPAATGSEQGDCPDCPAMVTVPAGTFEMGKTVDYGYGDMDGPTHAVTLRQPFALASHEVTLGEFRAFVRATGHVSKGRCNVYKEDTKWFIDPERSWADPGFPQQEDHPVVCVTWRDAQAYIKWLSDRTGRRYRLPSEAEWEYVASSADIGNTRTGGSVTHDVANIGKVECCGGEVGGRDKWHYTAPVGSFPGDKFGLHDIIGNVWEWLGDCYNQDYNGAPVDGTARESCPAPGFNVVRGGSYGDGGEFLSYRFRLRGTADQGYFTVGFRVAQTEAATNDLRDQQALQPIVNSADATLQFDWPMLRIGTGEYEEGPTGVTVFHFSRKVMGAVDVRGGGPGTVNTDYLRLGYEAPELDAVVLAGGSWYGLEATTAVATALKDDGLRDGSWMGLALSVGAIIYDLGDRRLNEIYPDKPLAQAAFRAARPGVFPLGAHGAGRLARTGGYFGCNAPSGQGGAFRQLGALKIAAFTVVNALGVVMRRDGSIAACYRDPGWPKDIKVLDLIAGLPGSRKPGWAGPVRDDAKRNTTISLVVTNQVMNPAELQRFAVQVHTSMARGIQPFATEFDGDVLYAVSTGELAKTEAPTVTSADIGIIASEVMWDAILASVPEQPVAAKPDTKLKLRAAELQSMTGTYVFSEFARIEVVTRDARVFAQATGARDAFSIRRNAQAELLPVAPGLFTVPGRYPLTVKFEQDRVVLNPGRWQQVGLRRK